MKKTVLLLAAMLAASYALAAPINNTTNDPQVFTHVWGGDVIHDIGGLWSRSIAIEAWSNPAPLRPYRENTIVKHDGELWVAFTAPGAADEPGVAAVWKKITGQGVTGTGGATISSGTADPAGGSDGDAYIQVDTSTVVQSLWLNISGTWTEYTIPVGSGGTITTSAPISGDGSAGDPATIANRAISHLKLGSTVGGVNQSAGRILEADGAGDVRWSDKGGGSGTSGDKLISIDFPTPDATNVYDVIDHLGHLYQNKPEVVGASVTWAASVDGDDVSSLWGETTGTYTFRGIEYVSDVTNPQSGNVILLPTGGFRHRGATRFSHLRNPDGWIGGPYADEDEADSHVTAINDVSAYDDALQLVTAYTAGTTHYQWVNIIDEVPLVHELTDAEVVDSTSDVSGTISGSQLDDFAPELGVAEATSKVSDELGRVSGRRIGEAIDAHVVPSTNATTDVAEASVIGTSVELSRDDHVHELPTDETLEWDASDQLGVNINDIIERVSETVQYFTDSTGNFDDSNHATMGEEYTTSRWQKAIHKVEIHIGHQSGDGELVYRAGVYEVEADGEIITVFGRSDIRDVGNSGRWRFDFHPPVIVDPLSRIIIVATREDEGNTTTARVLEGTESGDSPNISYIDAGEDFDRVHRVTYTEDYPVVGTTRQSHDANFVRGNIKIWYTNTYHEGLLVGDGSVNIDHLDSGSQPVGRIMETDGAEGFRYIATPGGGGGAGTAVDGVDVGYAQGTRVLGVEVQQDNGTDLSDNVTLPEATTIVAGLVETATNAEATAGTASDKALTPSNLASIFGSVVSDTDIDVAAPSSESTAVAPSRQAVAEAIAANSGGTDDQTAAEVSLDTSTFTRNLTPADNTLQLAMQTIDGFTQYQGAWQQASWPAGVIVTRSGIAYISLVNNNTEIPTPASTQWSGLPEGFSYRGEAPIAATNYNYGQAVLEPDTDVYYYFTSTISASVARADIATHPNFHVIGGETGHAPRVDSGNAFPTTPAPVDNDIFFFDADVASGLDWKDTDGTTDLTAATGGDMARFDGTDWVKVINLVGGGGGTTARTVLVDAVGVSNTAGPHEITLTEAMVPRQLLTVFVFSSAAASPDGIGYVLSDDVLALTAEATAPTDAENALPVVTASYSAANFSQQSGNYFVYRKDDSTLWVRPTRLAAHTLTITATPLGGGATAQAQGAGGRQIVERNIITTRTPIAEFGLDAEWTNVDGVAPTFTAIPRADMDRIELAFWVNSSFVYPIVLTRAMLTAMGPTNNPLPTGLVGSDTIPGAFLTFRSIATAESREPILLNPQYGFMEARRMANRCGIFVHMNDNSNNDWANVGWHVVCDDQVDVEYVRAYYYEDIS